MKKMLAMVMLLVSVMMAASAAFAQEEALVEVNGPFVNKSFFATESSVHAITVGIIVNREYTVAEKACGFVVNMNNDHEYLCFNANESMMSARCFELVFSMENVVASRVFESLSLMF